MCSPEHTHVAIQNSPDNVRFHYIWSIPRNSIPKSFPSLSIHFSFIHISLWNYRGFVPFLCIKYPICPWSKYGHATYHSNRESVLSSHFYLIRSLIAGKCTQHSMSKLVDHTDGVTVYVVVGIGSWRTVAWIDKMYEHCIVSLVVHDTQCGKDV